MVGMAMTEWPQWQEPPERELDPPEGEDEDEDEDE